MFDVARLYRSSSRGVALATQEPSDDKFCPRHCFSTQGLPPCRGVCDLVYGCDLPSGALRPTMQLSAC